MDAQSRTRKLVGPARYAMYVVIIVVAPLLVYLFWRREMAFFLVPSKSMEPTLRVGDYLLALSEATYERGDIVIVADPIEKGGYLVKRVVAVGGDVVFAAFGVLFVNGRPFREPYIKEPMQYTTWSPVRVPDNEIYLLGDNRNESDDCHLWRGELRDGIPVDDVIGRVRYIYLPFGRIARVKRTAPKPFEQRDQAVARAQLAVRPRTDA